jgi:hypothetical protein
VGFEAFLDLLIAKGVRKYRGPFVELYNGKLVVPNGDAPELDLEFGPPAPPALAAPAGELANLDEGMPDLAKDPDDIDQFVRANWPGAPKAT